MEELYRAFEKNYFSNIVYVLMWTLITSGGIQYYLTQFSFLLVGLTLLGTVNVLFGVVSLQRADYIVPSVIISNFVNVSAMILYFL